MTKKGQQVNPFTPLFGKVPSVIAGRQDVILSIVDALESPAVSPELCSIIKGMRGSGKTTLLRHLAFRAQELGWVCAYTTATKGMLNDLLIKTKNASSHLIEDNRGKKLTHIGIGNAFSVSWENEEKNYTNWQAEITALLDELAESQTGIFFVVDEVDSSLPEMIQLATVFQMLLGENKKVALLMAGLPNNISSLLTGKTTSFLRRSQQFNLGCVPDFEIKEAFRLTVEEGGKKIGQDALDVATKAICGFPFLMQLVGFRAWNASASSEVISVEHVEQGVKVSKEEIKTKIFEATFNELSEADKEFLFAMNKKGEFTERSTIAKETGRDSSWISRHKKRLLQAGVIEEPRQGKFKFSLPSFAEFLEEEKQNASWLP